MSQLIVGVNRVERVNSGIDGSVVNSQRLNAERVLSSRGQAVNNVAGCVGVNVDDDSAGAGVGRVGNAIGVDVSGVVGVRPDQFD